MYCTVQGIYPISYNNSMQSVIDTMSIMLFTCLLCCLPETNIILQGSTSGKEPACRYRRCKRLRFHLWVRKIPWRRARQPTPVLLPGESHGQGSPAGYRPGGHKESDTTEWLSTAQHLTSHTKKHCGVLKLKVTSAIRRCTWRFRAGKG